MRYDQEKFIEALNKLSQRDLEEVFTHIQEKKRVELREAVKKFDIGPMASGSCPLCGK